ncbi:hypothetical protein [Streptomyces antibioticus]
MRAEMAAPAWMRNRPTRIPANALDVGDVFTGVLTVAVPFPVETDLGQI